MARLEPRGQVQRPKEHGVHRMCVPALQSLRLPDTYLPAAKLGGASQFDTNVCCNASDNHTPFSSGGLWTLLENTVSWLQNAGPQVPMASTRKSLTDTGGILSSRATDGARHARLASTGTGVAVSRGGGASPAPAEGSRAACSRGTRHARRTTRVRTGQSIAARSAPGLWSFTRRGGPFVNSYHCKRSNYAYA